MPKHDKSSDSMIALIARSYELGICNKDFKALLSETLHQYKCYSIRWVCWYRVSGLCDSLFPLWKWRSLLLHLGWRNAIYKAISNILLGVVDKWILNNVLLCWRMDEKTPFRSSHIGVWQVRILYARSWYRTAYIRPAYCLIKYQQCSLLTASVVPWYFYVF